MRPRKKRPIPDFATYEEAARFFDETDTTTLEYDEELFTTFPDQPTASKQGTADKVHVPVEIGRAQFKRLASAARQAGQTPNVWLKAVIGDALRRSG
jgi:hypothetical protein